MVNVFVVITHFSIQITLLDVKAVVNICRIAKHVQIILHALNVLMVFI